MSSAPSRCSAVLLGLEEAEGLTGSTRQGLEGLDSLAATPEHVCGELKVGIAHIPGCRTLWLVCWRKYTASSLCLSLPT